MNKPVSEQTNEEWVEHYGDTPPVPTLVPVRFHVVCIHCLCRPRGEDRNFNGGPRADWSVSDRACGTVAVAFGTGGNPQNALCIITDTTLFAAQATVPI
jgi:hypothetical protein